MTATTARRPARPSTVRPHTFDRDRTVPMDRRGRAYCLWCHLPGVVGDERHPMPEVPDEARDRDAAILGERV